MTEVKEDSIINLRTIVHFLQEENNKNVRRLMIDDLKYKTDMIISNEKKIQRSLDYDIALITIVPIEIEAAQKVFSIDDRKVLKDDESGLRMWEFNLNRFNRDDKLRCIAIMVGDVGSINCTLACLRLFNKYNIKLAILTGIAAGLKNHVDKYSCIVANAVVDYEFQRLEKNGVINYRPDPMPILDPRLKRDVSSFLRKTKSWKSKYFTELDKYENKILSKSLRNTLFKNISLVEGTIASGAKLFANGKSLRTLNDDIKIKKGIIAAEMEGSGFSHICDEYKIKWLVFRGISDYGGPDKNSKQNKKYQIFAAISAMIAVKIFLEEELTME